MDGETLWLQLHDFFDPDDGSLPEIWLVNLSGVGVERAFAFWWGLADEATRARAFFWDKTEQRHLVRNVANAAAWVTQGIAYPFHIVLTGITWQDVPLPQLGVTVFEDSLYLDYRKGTDQGWGPAPLNALFACLAQLQTWVPEMDVRLEAVFPKKSQALLQAAWQQYRQEMQLSLKNLS